MKPVYGYLDIETTGLNPRCHRLTVIGLHIEGYGGDEFIQMVGEDIEPEGLRSLLEGIDQIYTYNGSRFDIPFIRESIGVDVNDFCVHRDLMYSCWERNLKGGLKAVERRLGIRRELPDVDGLEAVRLWRRYEEHGCLDSLRKLLEYNREDVQNLRRLRHILGS